MATQEDGKVIALIGNLSNGGRRLRQEVSHELHELALSEPERLLDYADELCEALFVPEAQTRWQILMTISELAKLDLDKFVAAVDGAEHSLFDESSASARLTAFLFLCTYAASAPERSEQVWPLIDEAIQCYHGDVEYRAMLEALLNLAKSADCAASVKQALAKRVSFDAANASGFIKTLSQELIKLASA